MYIGPLPSCYCVYLFMSFGFSEALEFTVPENTQNTTTIFLYIYEVFAVFIVINLLIAVINNTISKVDNNRFLYWQFTKASMQVSFFEDSFAVPCPWNIMSPIRIMFRLFAVTLGISEDKLCGGKEPCNVNVTPTFNMVQGGDVFLTDFLS